MFEATAQAQPRRVLAFAGATMAVDWAVKFWAVSSLEDAPIDWGWIRFRLHRNEGIAFSIGEDLPVWVILLITGAVVALLTTMALRGAFQPAIGAGLVVGGGLGNLLDRLVNGSVIDMFDLGWWPAFNVADVALNVGVGLILLWSIFFAPDDEELRTEPPPPPPGHV